MPLVLEPVREPKTLPEAVEILMQLNSNFNALYTSLTKVLYAAPAKPREGVFAFADGTTWNPGSGRGLYQYVSGAWAKL